MIDCPTPVLLIPLCIVAFCRPLNYKLYIEVANSSSPARAVKTLSNFFKIYFKKRKGKKSTFCHKWHWLCFILRQRKFCKKPFLSSQVWLDQRINIWKLWTKEHEKIWKKSQTWRFCFYMNWAETEQSCSRFPEIISDYFSSLISSLLDPAYFSCLLCDPAFPWEKPQSCFSIQAHKSAGTNP